MRVARLEPLLHGLRDELVPFAQEIAARPAARRRVRAPHLPGARAARRRRAPGGRDRLRLRGRAARRGGPPVRLRLRAGRRAPDDARARGRPLLRALRRAARGGPRPLRAGPHGRDRGHVLRQRHLARPARVAVALLGEHGRPLARVLGAPPRRGQGAFPEQLARRLARAVRARRQPRRAVADPRRGRRGHLPPARLPALRARARAAARRSRRRRSAGGLERAHAHARRHRGAERRASACCRTSTGRPA